MELQQPVLNILEICSRVPMSFAVSFLQQSPLERTVSLSPLIDRCPRSSILTANKNVIHVFEGRTGLSNSACFFVLIAIST